MKVKKTAFANTSTGYGKTKSNHNHTHSHNRIRHSSNQKGVKSEGTGQTAEKIVCDDSALGDGELNSGFGEYLRSPQAIEMMKLFVFANSIMLILTMAWPNIKEQYYMVMAWWSQ